MFKKQTPQLENLKRVISQFPHCDQRVLHAPGECEYCDRRPDWQALRLAWGIAFTGWVPDENEIQCPSEKVRSIETINRWPGNRPAGKSV